MQKESEKWEEVGDGIMMRDGSSPRKSNSDCDMQMKDETEERDGNVKGQLKPDDPRWTEQQWAQYKDKLFESPQQASTAGSLSIPLQPVTPGVVDPVPNHVSQVKSSTEALKTLKNSVWLSLMHSWLDDNGAGLLGGLGGSGDSGWPGDTNPSVKDLMEWNLHSIGAVAVSSEFLDSHLRDLEWMRLRLEEHYTQTLRLRLMAEKNLAAIERALFMESRRNMLAEAIQMGKD